MCIQQTQGDPCAAFIEKSDRQGSTPVNRAIRKGRDKPDDMQWSGQVDIYWLIFKKKLILQVFYRPG